MTKDYLAIIQRDGHVLETCEFYDKKAAEVYAKDIAVKYKCLGLVTHIKTIYHGFSPKQPQQELIAEMLSALEGALDMCGSRGENAKLMEWDGPWPAVREVIEKAKKNNV